MAIDGFQTNGSALVYINTGFGLELLGYTQAGADVTYNRHVEPIFTDIFGPRVPHDVQDFGMTAEVSLPIIASDRTVLTRALTRGDASTPFSFNTAGLCLGSAGYGVVLGIASPADAPWVFRRAHFSPSWRTRLGTKAEPLNLSFLALPVANFQTVAAKDTPFVTRSF